MTFFEEQFQPLWQRFDKILNAYHPTLSLKDMGIVQTIGNGIANVSGLPDAESEELLRFPGDSYGLVFNLDNDIVGAILLDPEESIKAGEEVYRTHRILEAPVGKGLLGRVVDGIGRPRDQGGSIQASSWWPVERPSPGIIERLPVFKPLQIGIKAIDALIPIGKGQRELIIGDRQIGKTAIAIDTIINQRDQNVICIYCSIGQKTTGVAKVINELREHQALPYTIVVVATGDDPAGLQFIAPYAATSMGEYFMNQGHDVLIIYDDLTRHAWVYRQLSLLLRRPPGREGYPGDIFYVHSRLLERSTHIRQELGGGSLTALPIIETEEQNISAYIPTNLISITDGQIYLSPQLFNLGILPAVDIGKSVSRVGGEAQKAAYRSVIGDLRLNYTQFLELEAFSKFGTRMEEETKKTLQHGRKIREVLKQSQFQPLSVLEQIAILYALNEGKLDHIPDEEIKTIEQEIRQSIKEHGDFLQNQINKDQKLSDEDKKKLSELLDKILKKRESIGENQKEKSS